MKVMARLGVSRCPIVNPLPNLSIISSRLPKDQTAKTFSQKSRELLSGQPIQFMCLKNISRLGSGLGSNKCDAMRNRNHGRGEKNIELTLVEAKWERKKRANDEQAAGVSD
ncbi:hypothetical protein KIN20_009443 [Parelaphostrongylus tenuis]|uniref:Uncharacterized protein n=1 Tax=Parelaphostrongylus tenuis TaxID=148309 RepID=A0AAD5QKN8_PARTN|nr:hypothetical protein KIN20_009443 [Parelaphostrongylus tenuis]